MWKILSGIFLVIIGWSLHTSGADPTHVDLVCSIGLFAIGSGLDTIHTDDILKKLKDKD